jgi:hypothetical protein
MAMSASLEMTIFRVKSLLSALAMSFDVRLIDMFSLGITLFGGGMSLGSSKIYHQLSQA